MEKKQKGEQFRILDYAKLPEKPISPNMKRMFFLAGIGGLGLGGGLIFLLDFFGTSIRQPDDFEHSTGVAVLATFLLHGAIFLSLKTTGDLVERARTIARRLWLPVVVILLVFLVATYLATDIYDRLGVNPGMVPLTGIIAILLAGYFACGAAQTDGLLG